MEENKKVQECTDHQDAKPDNLAGGVADQGLCINCENRLICTFDKPAGGVWWCEGYQ
ncbi:hypothetical protein KAJ27_05530 [bacterium]|nr:hypothetical protein [bacterium]